MIGAFDEDVPRLEPRPPAALFESIVEDAGEFVAVVDDDLQVVYASRAIRPIIGYLPAEVVGRSIIDFLHPDDVDRAASAVSGAAVWGNPAGTTSFRVRHADGSWITIDVTAANVTDGERRYFGVYGRPADYQPAVDAILAGLLDGAPFDEVVGIVGDVFEWKLNDTQVGIAWFGGGRFHHATTGDLPAVLTGGDDDPGEPWERARRTGAAVELAGPDALDPARRRAAIAAGRGPMWIEPVADPCSDVPILVTLAVRRDGPPPRGHSYGMELARTYLQLIFRWTEQADRLAEAASTDALTGLANRRSLFAALDADPGPGAVLYCDLDRFKAINDEHGHHVGDALLQAVADRLRGCVRTGDLVARTGGDEFVVLASGADDACAADLARRITEVVGEPYRVLGLELEIGVSVGVARDASRLTEATLVVADRALFAAKADRQAHGDR